MTNTVATTIAPVEGASASGRLFAKSEIDANESLELFARDLGTEPTFEHWSACRISWVNSYVDIKPQAKGNSADKAFARFRARLTDAYGIDVPKAKSESASKKATERANKALALEENYSKYNDEEITGMLQKAYENQAKNPMKKVSVLSDLQKIAKARAKAQNEENRESLKVARERLYTLAKACTDADLIDQASDLLDQ